MSRDVTQILVMRSDGYIHVLPLVTKARMFAAAVERMRIHPQVLAMRQTVAG